MAGIYIHIPFCRQACTYCDFHFSTSTQLVESMIESIRKESIIRKEYISNEKIETIYFGGGTPSLISTQLIGSILDTLKENFDIAGDAEITLEANPDDLTIDKCKSLFKTGINRLSIGIQSFEDDVLKFFNRAHDSKMALSSVRNAKEAGFDNISIDLIYGLKGSINNSWGKNLDLAFELDVDHLSCYALTIEPRTALADMIRKQKVLPPDDENVSSDFEILMTRSAAEGFEHYEISNFARNKMYAKHNTSYWQRKKYLGLGPSAHSYNYETRQWNISNNHEYVKSIQSGVIPFEIETLSEKNKFNEYILTSLRTMWGIDLEFIEKEFGINRKKELLRQIDLFVKQGKILFSGNNYILTKTGKYFADRIAAELFAGL